MSNTYTQLHIHIVFAVKGRQSLIQETWKDELYKYMTGIVQNNGHKMLAINGMPDHIHFFIGLNPKQGLSKLVNDVKTSSNKFIKNKNWTRFNFAWQEGYGAFSHSKSQVDAVVKYIVNQELHHKKKSFREEYLEILHKFEIEFKEEYLFDFIEDLSV